MPALTAVAVAVAVQELQRAVVRGCFDTLRKNNQVKGMPHVDGGLGHSGRVGPASHVGCQRLVELEHRSRETPQARQRGVADAERWCQRMSASKPDTPPSVSRTSGW